MNEIRKFIFPSTGLVYGDHLSRPATEKDPTVPKNFYIATKVSAEALTAPFLHSTCSHYS